MSKIREGKPFGEWVKYYEDKDHSKFMLHENEELCYERDRGFFTWDYNVFQHLLIIPKMCGDGKYFRPKIRRMGLRARQIDSNFKGILFCTKRNPKVYMRIVGGRLYKQEKEDGKTYSYILVDPRFTKVPMEEPDDK